MQIRYLRSACELTIAMAGRFVIWNLNITILLAAIHFITTTPQNQIKLDIYNFIVRFIFVSHLIREHSKSCILF